MFKREPAEEIGNEQASSPAAGLYKICLLLTLPLTTTFLSTSVLPGVRKLEVIGPKHSLYYSTS